MRRWRPQVERLAATPFETDQAYWRAVIEARLASAKPRSPRRTPRCSIAARAATSPTAAAQRRLRESYFVAIVTPAIKQLKKMLADMAH